MGDVYEWRGDSGSFSTGGNWDDFTSGVSPAANPPGSSDYANLNTDNASATVSGDGDVATLDVDDNITLTGALTAEASVSFSAGAGASVVTVSGGSITAKYSMAVDTTVDVVQGGALAGGEGLTDYGVLSINDGTLTATLLGVGGALLLTDGQITVSQLGVGSNPGVPTTLDIGSGGTLSDSSGNIGLGPSDESTATVHAGGVWQNSGNVIVGTDSAGTLDITTGGSVSILGGSVPQGIGALVVGLGSGQGVLDIDGAGSVLSLTGDADFGIAGGTAKVTLSAGGSLDVSGTILAGTADIDVNAGSLTIGQGLTMSEIAATLEIEGGGTVSAPASPNQVTIDATIDIDNGQYSGHYLAASGPITVQNGTLASNHLLLGGSTGGVTTSATLESDGLMNAAIAELGPQTGDKAIVYLQADSTLQTGVQLFVGAGGTGGLDIEGGLVNAEGGATEGSAALDAGALNAAAFGTIAMDGAGSSLVVTGAAVLGDAGTGSLLLGTHSSFTVSFGLYEGAQSTSGGFLQDTDSSDTFSVGGDWVIGDAGGHVDLIEGGAGVSVGGALTIARGGGSGSLTITDSGSAVGVTGDITVGMSGSGTLEVESGAMLTSTGGGFTVSSGSADIGSNAGIGAASAAIDAGGTLSLAGGTLTAAGGVTVSGSLSGHGSIAAQLTDNGTVTASGGLLTVQGLVGGSGVLAIDAATLDLQAGISAGPTVAFSGGSLLLDTPGAAGATLAGFAAGDTIVLQGVIANAGTFAGGVLILEDGDAAQASLSFSGAYDSDNFSVVSTGGQTTVSYVACFAAGTRIATPGGPVAVEALRQGEPVVTAFGATAPVVWLGHRRIDCRRHPRPWEVWPVRVRADAFGPGRPGRDLRLSPDHAVHVQGDAAPGVLIPIRYLINGATIVQEPAEAVTYWHVELPTHNVVLAEGLACETYLDTGNRGAFANGGAALHLHPSFALGVWDAKSCAKLALDGPDLLAARRRNLARAGQLGHRLTDDAALHLLVDGEALWPVAVEGTRHRFALRRRVATLRIRSRGGIPAQVNADSDDHRRLGVMIERIAAFRPWQWQEVALAELPGGIGFHRLEETEGRRWRWTDGDAGLPVPPEWTRDGVLLLDIHVVAAQPTWCEAAACAPSLRAAS